MGRQLPLAMLVNERLLVHVTHSTADVPVSARSSHPMNVWILRYHGACTPSAWLTSYRLAGDNQLDRSEIGDGYGGESCCVGAGQQAGRDCRHDRPSPAAARPISR